MFTIAFSPSSVGYGFVVGRIVLRWRLWITEWWIRSLFGWVDWVLQGALEGLSQLAWEHLRPKIDGDEDRKRYTEDP
jgi:hypothetical protein